MSRWFRFYDDVINDPKVLCLPEALRWQWVSILCIASKHNGGLPGIEHIALMLRTTKHRAAAVLTGLHNAGLLDKTETGFVPHNWDARQFKSDVSTERVKRFRNAKPAVSETPTETDNRIQKEPEATASGADAPRDIRADLFKTGLETLAKITGKTPDSSRSLVGKWLKDVNDEAIHVLGAIQDAERNHVADPVAWINRTLNPHRKNANGQPQQNSLKGALGRLSEEISRREGEAGRDDEGRALPPRLLSHG